MKKPSKFYFQPESGTDAIMALSKWLSSGLTVKQIARWIHKDYASTDNPATKLHLGLLLCALYYRDPKIALEVGQLFNLKKFRAATTGECAFCMAATLDTRKSSFEWQKELSSKYQPEKTLENFVVPGFSPKDALSIADSIGIIREKETGHLRLMFVCNNPRDILADEENFDSEPPLYFTEYNHFVSPVWLINIAHKILVFILQAIGYPPIQINRQVIFTNPEAHIINRDEYEEIWGEVIVDEARIYGDIAPIPETAPISSGEVIISNITGILKNVVGCTSALFTELNPLSNNDITQKTILHAAKKMKIFT